MNRLTLSTVLILLATNISIGGISPRDTTYNKSISANLIAGYLQYHYDEMAILRDGPAVGFEVAAKKSADGSMLWHKFYGFPEYGITYSFFDLGNRKALGYAHCLSPFINMPIINFNKFHFGLLISTGISYNTKIYSALNNPQNIAISSPLNAYVNLGISVKYSINEFWALESSFRLTHFSNGTFKKPNSGLNYTLFSVGINYSYPQSVRLTESNKYSFTDNVNRFLIAGYGSFKEIKDPGGARYGVGAFSFEFSRPIKTLWRYGFSWDIMYDHSHKTILELENVNWDSKWQLYKSGVTFNTEFILNRLSAVFYFGGYLYNKSSSINNEYLYQRIGLRHRLSNQVWFNLSLKTHWNIADYVEMGVAIKIH